MEIDIFFEHLLEELRHTDVFESYYKFHGDDSRFEFRKNYFTQRLQYILDNMPKDREIEILDIGCGYGTTAIFLALNGYKVKGITLEFYIDALDTRMQYWSQIGDVSGFTYEYKDLFDGIGKEVYDIIIAQDTLHHLEPLGDAMAALSEALRHGGHLMAIEENGDNVIQNLKLIKQRGFKKVKTIYDERLKKDILIGDENIRGLSTWTARCQEAGLIVKDESIEFVRYVLPNRYDRYGKDEIIPMEKRVSANSPLKRKYLFFGLNFMAVKV